MSARKSGTQRRGGAGHAVVSEESSARFSSERDGGRGRGSGRSRGRGRSDTTLREDYTGNTSACYGHGSVQGRGRGRGSARVLHEALQQQNTPATDGTPASQGTGSPQANRPPQLWTLRDFMKLKDADATNISSQLTNPNRDFPGFLKSEDISPTAIEAIFCVLAKLVSEDGANVQPSTFNDIYLILTQSRFLDRLATAAIALATDFKARLDERQLLTNRLLQNVASYFQVVIFAIPLTACNSISPTFFANFLALKPIIELNGIKVAEDIFNMYTELNRTFQEELESRKAPAPQPTKSLLYDSDMYDVAPPDNFRRLSVTPTIEDLTSTSQPFLRPLRIQGEYPNVSEYLDHQFRLLREDFFHPLRSGIQEYIKYTRNNPQGHNFRRKKVRFDNVRVYFDVKEESYQVAQGSHIISFSVDGLQNIQWDCSKRLLFGSLLVLTSDNFRSILLATITNRKPEELARGRLEVKFEDAQLHQNKLNKVFIMVESNVYFEAYRSTLETLQKISDNDLALQDYFLGRVKQPRPPKYLQERGQPPVYDLRCLAPKTMDNGTFDGSLEIRDLGRVAILDPARRPTPEALGMDSSQAVALYASLTQELAIVQGPPGTGKTYMGLKITQVLLENAEIWQSRTPNPIVVVCYTNHALDQFLEGIMNFTKNIVRVGGQSRNETLAPFSLPQRRRDIRYRRSDLSQWSRSVKDKAEELLGRIIYLEKGIAATTARGIVNRQVFEEFGVFDDRVLGFFRSTTLGNWLFVYWEHNLAQTLTCLRQSATKKGNAAAPEEAIAHWPTVTKSTVVDKENNEEEEEEWEKEEINDILEQRLAFEQDIQRDVADAVQLLAKRNFPTFLEYGFRAIDDEIEDVRLLLQLESGEKEETVAHLNRLQQRRQVLREVLQCIPPLSEEKAQLLLSRDTLLHMTIAERWMLYGYWVQKLVARLQEELAVLTNEYHKLNRKRKDIETAENAEICRGAKVIGLTTTGAAKHRQLLLQLKPKIVIVEEAAEVLESHIATSLSAHCEQLILIGDHQQLRPPTSVYHLAKKFHLDVSFFERLIANGLPSNRLTLQHRMRPEVARLIVPHIYPVLENHSSVLCHQKVLGVDKNVFFLTHTEHEDAELEGKSHLNTHEAQVALFLAKHLLLQGYEPEKITILTTYSGQLMHMRKLRKQHAMLKAVRITIVDNFQGEENDIIILSLVRSNEEQNIGFLRTENRICVSLSRAKQGFFLLGNMNVLEGKSRLWRNISRTLENHGEIGNALPLRCVIHPEMVTEITTARDFAPVAEGGCTRKCETRLLCGHICSRVCHVVDRNHESYNCREACSRISCPEGHACPLKCYQECGKCQIKVLRKLPCQHEQELPCHVPPSSAFCSVVVEKTLPECQHVVEAPCGQSVNDIKCTLKCEKPPPCGHQCSRSCHAKPGEDPDHLMYKCYAPCSRNICEEGHPCPRRCFKKCEQCQVMVERELSCGHKATFPCHFTNSEQICPVPVERVLTQCGHKVKMPCGESPDTFPCPLPCDIRLDCGHQCTQKCHALEDPEHEEYLCLKPCGKLLQDCKRQHDCRKKCFEDCDRCERKITHQLPCGHIMDAPCHANPEELAKICNKMVTRIIPECGHSVAMKCSAEPLHCLCTQSCKRKLHCGHECRQPCKDPCRQALCEAPIPLREVLECGHPVHVPCSQAAQARQGEAWEAAKQNMLLSCAEPCCTLLPCEHACKGTCGRCFQGRVHVACEEKCERPLICGHSCKVNCSVSCPACTEPCLYRCIHSRCSKKCGEPCADCKEPCQWRCEHYRCTKKCSALCNRPRCDEPCPRKLKCGHICVGLCGEPCPPLCRVCDEEEITKIVFGSEDAEDAKFVWLEDCGHCIEVGALDYWMDKNQTEDEEIMLKVCPLCKTAIQRSGRYGNVIKRHYEDIVSVKASLYGREKTLQALLKELHRKLQDVVVPAHLNFSTLSRCIDQLRQLTYVRNKKRPPNLDQSGRFLVQVQTEVVLKLLKLAKSIVPLPRSPEDGTRGRIEDPTLQLAMFQKINSIADALFSRKHRISSAEYTDFRKEVRRLDLLRAFYVVRSSPFFATKKADVIFRSELAKVFPLEKLLPLTSEQEDSIRVALEKMGEMLKTGLGISDQERSQILAALNLPRQGHWYKCPNGHVYVITECGGAMQESVCNECGAKIGGGQHRLRGDNAVATEMDGAHQPAWPPRQ